MPESTTDYTYDAFISYSHTDSSWVQDWLLPHLEHAGLRICIDIRDFDIGLPSIVNMEHAVERSRRTLIVMTPAWVASEWTDFEALLTQTSDPAGRRRRIIPLLLEPCQPPNRIAMLTYADFTKELTRDAQLERVISAIRGDSVGAQGGPLRQPVQENKRDLRPVPSATPSGSVQISGGTTYGPVVGTNTGSVTTTYMQPSVRPGGPQPAASTSMPARPIRILFLAANPSDNTRLRIDAEIRSIDQALRLAEHREHFDLRQHFAVRTTDLQELLLRHRPDIVHFSGHGSPVSELMFENELGREQPVPPAALARLFKVLKDNIRCVVLNACYSRSQAEAIAEHIDCVVGMSDAIFDTSALSFATAFYRALGYGRDVQTAFDLGCLQIAMNSEGGDETPDLIATHGDPQRLIFVAAEPGQLPN